MKSGSSRAKQFSAACAFSKKKFSSCDALLLPASFTPSNTLLFCVSSLASKKTSKTLRTQHIHLSVEIQGQKKFKIQKSLSLDDHARVARPQRKSTPNRSHLLTQLSKPQLCKIHFHKEVVRRVSGEQILTRDRASTTVALQSQTSNNSASSEHRTFAFLSPRHPLLPCTQRSTIHPQEVFTRSH